MYVELSISVSITTQWWSTKKVYGDAEVHCLLATDGAWHSYCLSWGCVAVKIGLHLCDVSYNFPHIEVIDIRDLWEKNVLIISNERNKVDHPRLPEWILTQNYLSLCKFLMH